MSLTDTTQYIKAKGFRYRISTLIKRINYNDIVQYFFDTITL